MKLATVLLRARQALYATLALLLHATLVLSSVLVHRWREAEVIGLHYPFLLLGWAASCLLLLAAHYLSLRSPSVRVELVALVTAFCTGFAAVHTLVKHLPASHPEIKRLGFWTHVVAAFAVDWMSYLVAIALYVGYRGHRALGPRAWKESVPSILAAVAPVQLPTDDEGGGDDETVAVDEARLTPAMVRVVGYAFAFATASATTVLGIIMSLWPDFPVRPPALVAAWAALTSLGILALGVRKRTTLRTESMGLGDLVLLGLVAMAYLSPWAAPEDCRQDALVFLLVLDLRVLLRTHRDGAAVGTFGEMTTARGLGWVFVPGEGDERTHLLRDDGE
ncbi:uncharacterized protein LOC62_01G000100 [Vanrija pseudolonga]|uniref:Uncharacterized protein n=1 Tax=Vanrija pseudolonga TaxID=143232 RepID=A0AAF0Y223_9TREE|nr:hypothetical protein LOC62_01G000100 [Vanrija pseudolonga]